MNGFIQLGVGEKQKGGGEKVSINTLDDCILKKE